MEKLYCAYCGELLSDGCECGDEEERSREYQRELSELYEGLDEMTPEQCAGAAFEDYWGNSHFNQR